MDTQQSDELFWARVIASHIKTALDEHPRYDAQFGDIRVHYDESKNIEINLEDAARGLGFVDAHFAKSGERWESVRWARVRDYLADIGYTGEVSKDGYIPEAVLYMLAMKTNNSAARKFQTWIADVITSVRKHGFYVTPNTRITPDFLRQLASTLEMKDAKIAAQEIQIAELTPKANYYDKVLNSGGLLTTTDIAKDYRMSAVKFNKLLERLQLGWSSGRTYLKNGSLIIAKTHMCWTQAGKHGLYNLLKEYGYCPSSELPSLFDLD